MIKKLQSFVKEYKHFALVVVAMLVSLGLDLANQDKYAHLLLSITAIGSLIPLLTGMWQSFRDGNYGLDILAITAIVSALLFKEYWTAMIIVLMLTGGEALEDYAEGRAKKELSTLLDNQPKKAHLVKGKTISDVAIKTVQIGDKILVKPGEVIPVDGEIIENGITSVDESSITGESLPIAKQSGDKVLSGSVNLSSSITLKVLHSAQDSQYQQIVKLVQSAIHSQAPFVRMADRYAIPFTVLSFTIAGLAWGLSGDSLRFLQVLVVATPCPLLLGAPIAMISGMSRAAKNGVIVKNGAALEKLAASKTIAFDKTGTLTQGKPVVENIIALNGYKKDDVLALAAALEQNSNHVLAVAITSAATTKKVTVPKIKHVKEFAGGGLEATARQGVVRIGTQRFLTEQGVVFSKDVASTEHTASYLAIDELVIGAITFVDEQRSNSKSTLERLKSLGVKHLLMVTGDNSKTANKIASKLGITDVRAECLPADKIIAIQDLEHKPVAFVGDGVNDAPVLTAANVGIALGARGSTAASETADIVIMQDDISRVADAVDISKRTMFIARQSIWIGILMSLGLMLVFATGRFKPATGAAVQELVDVAVIINALRAHRGKLRS
ncbi:cadmium-translocating P-type ATPase [bacterium]|nr:cadmium-translocating P-type ATPase [bacterium]NBX97682.1 cadmium-translocating P-type ATPase [bacterium]NDC94155.1 cadmium-translocating P-type ATPase [bacterium]NDD83152.1 cadmium-translocating P-type ATPase [bacterium]NDG29375.1 cadmium-translocating P-type ATPase [bacterium]